MHVGIHDMILILVKLLPFYNETDNQEQKLKQRMARIIYNIIILILHMKHTSSTGRATNLQYLLIVKIILNNE